MNLVMEEDGIKIVGEVQVHYEKLHELKQQVPCCPPSFCFLSWSFTPSGCFTSSRCLLNV